MPDFLMNALPSAVIALVILLLGVVAYRPLMTKQLGEIRQQVIETYQANSAAQQEELTRLRHEVAAMRAAFRHLGMTIEISGNEAILIDEQKPKRTRIMTVNIDEDAEKNDLDNPTK